MSAKTVAQKLAIKPQATLWLSHPERSSLIAPLPNEVQIVATLAQASAALLFADNEQSLRALLAAHKDHLTRPAILWVAYPKGNRTDLNRDTLWPILAEYGLRPNRQIAVDEVWSALRFRLRREGESPFTGG